MLFTKVNAGAINPMGARKFRVFSFINRGALFMSSNHQVAQQSILLYIVPMMISRHTKSKHITCRSGAVDGATGGATEENVCQKCRNFFAVVIARNRRQRPCNGRAGGRDKESDEWQQVFSRQAPKPTSKRTSKRRESRALAMNRRKSALSRLSLFSLSLCCLQPISFTG